MQQLPLGIRIPDRAVFATFLEGPNGQAVAALRSLAAGTTTGTVWLCGPSGVGKTHLLQATCVLASERARAGYFPLRRLSPLGAAALEGLTELGCICVDDVEAVAGDPEWERALFGLVRELDERGGRLLAASTSPPALIAWSLADLGSRCAASTIFQLKGLDEREQRRALEMRAQLRGLELPEETVRWLQRRFPRDMRTLYELLDTLDEASLVERRRLTVPFIRSVLRARAQA